MRFPWAAVALVLSLVTEAQAANVQCKQDSCLKAINGNKNLVARRKQDCSNFLATTVTPAAKTILKTKTITQTKTYNPPVTKTNTVRSTVTITSSVRATSTRKVTATVSKVQTSTTTSFTRTVTITAAPSNAVVKRAASPTPAYASVCGAKKAYKSACLCAGAQAKTVTAQRPTVTGTITKTQTRVVTGRPTTVATRLVTLRATATVTKTFTTITVTQTVATATITSTATKTVNGATTVTVQPEPSDPPSGPRTGRIAMETPWFGGMTLYLAPHLAQWTPREWDTTGNGDVNLASVYKYTGSSQHLQLFRAPDWEESEGLTLFHDPKSAKFGPSGGNGIISRFSPVNPGNGEASLASRCSIAADKRFRCLWDDSGVFADWWMCNGLIALVKPGADAAPKCNEDNENTFKIDALRWYDVDDATPTPAVPDPVTPSPTPGPTHVPQTPTSDPVTPTPGPTEDPQTPTGGRTGKIQIGGWTLANSGVTWGEANSYAFCGVGDQGMGDLLRYQGPGSPVTIVRAGYSEGAASQGLDVFYDPVNSRFGPSATDVTFLAAWNPPSDSDLDQLRSSYGAKCVIDDSNNDFKCYWDGDGADFAEFWFCSGYLTLVRPGTTQEQMDGSCDFGNQYTERINRVTWIDDGGMKLRRRRHIRTSLDPELGPEA